MRTIMIVTALAAIAVAPVSAETIYRCRGEEGRPIFSDRPCSDKAEEVNLKVRRPSEEEVKQAEDRAAETKTFVRKAVLDEQIAAVEGQIRAEQRLMEAEVSLAQTKKGLARNNLAGATYEHSLSAEMQASVAKANANIRVLQDRLERLRAEREKLGE